MVVSPSRSRLVDVFGDVIAELDVEVERVHHAHRAVAASRSLGKALRGELRLDLRLVPVRDREADMVDVTLRRRARIVAGIVHNEEISAFGGRGTESEI